MSSISHAPISSPVNSQTYQMWLESVGRHLNNATNVKTVTSTDGNSKVNYVLNGCITYINYTGTGGFECTLPTKCKLQSFLQVSDGTSITILKDAKVVTIPTYLNTVTIAGSYLNDV